MAGQVRHDKNLNTQCGFHEVAFEHPQSHERQAKHASSRLNFVLFVFNMCLLCIDYLVFSKHKSCINVLWFWLLLHRTMCPKKKKNEGKWKVDCKIVISWATTQERKHFECKNVTDCGTESYRILYPTLARSAVDLVDPSPIFWLHLHKPAQWLHFSYLPWLHHKWHWE